MKKQYQLILLMFFAFSIMKANTARYRLIITDDPATTVMIAWDQQSGSNPVVYYDTVDHGTNYASYAYSKTVDRTSSYRGMTNTFAKLSGLNPNTNYYFVVRDSQGTSQRFWFRTAPDTNDTMSFISGGDSRNNRTPRQNANLLVSKLKPTAVFFGGDMTNSDTNAEWQDWFDDWQLTIASDGRIFPIIPARGNHEDSNNVIYNLFNVPSSSAYYKITFGANLYSVYTLNSEISAGGTQGSWLSSQLQSDTSIWKSAQYHKPMRPHVGSKSEGTDEYNNWSQLFYNYGVNLVYESDSHTVKTTWPIAPCSGGTGCDEGFVRDDTNGTVYVGEGCWGAPLRSNNDAKSWTRDAGSFNQFKWVCVSPTTIELKTINVNNASSVGQNANTSVCTLPANSNTWGDTVIIGVPLQKPMVTITNPTDGQHFNDGANILIEASATDSDGTITSMSFLVDGVPIGTDNTAPFSIAQSIADGAHTIEAIATDNDGQTGNDIISVTIGAFSDVIEVTIGSDVEEGEGDGNIYSGSSDLEMVYDSYNGQGYQTVGLHFNAINIPQGATIDEAYIQFTADETNADNAALLIYIEQSDNAQDYSSNSFDVSNRIACANPNVYWSPNAWSSNENSTDTRTPNLKDLVQEVISRAAWNSGNNMNFMIQGTGVSLTSTNAKRVADSGNAVLHIAYTVDNATLCLAPKAFLQGPMMDAGGSLMDDSLRSGGYLPLTSPYPDAVIAPSCVFETTGNDAIVDWVWLEIRDANDSSIIVASTSALIQRDGDIVNYVDGTSTIKFGLSSGDYFLALHHRSHLAAMTNLVALDGSCKEINFSDGSLTMHGTNALVTIPSGIEALWSGNTSGSSAIKFLGSGNDSDKIKDLVLGASGNIFGSITYAYVGYINGDVNMDATTKFSGSGNDSDLIKDNVLSHPGNIFSSITFAIEEQMP